MRVRGAGAVSLTWPHFGATVALTAGSGPTPAHSAGPDLHRSNFLFFMTSVHGDGLASC
jgi:hypothetical protein